MLHLQMRHYAKKLCFFFGHHFCIQSVLQVEIRNNVTCCVLLHKRQVPLMASDRAPSRGEKAAAYYVPFSSLNPI